MRTVLKLQHLTCQAQDIIDDLDIEEEDRPLATSLHGDCTVAPCSESPKRWRGRQMRQFMHFVASQGARWLHVARCPGDPSGSPNFESSQAADQGRHPAALRSLRQGQQRHFLRAAFPTAAPAFLRKGAAWPPDGRSHDNQQDEARLGFSLSFGYGRGSRALRKMVFHTRDSEDSSPESALRCEL